jgi:hypothetical protein
MIEDRQILEMNARAIAIMHFYCDGSMTSRRAQMTSEIRAVAEWFAGAKMGQAATVERVLEPIAAELVERYGPKAGPRLNAEFVKAFVGRAAPMIPTALATV